MRLPWAALLVAGLIFLTSLLPAMSMEKLECGPDRSFVSDAIKSEGMVFIKGGSFRMGSDEEHREERTEHQVTVSSFWIDQHEVTNDQFAEFVNATGYLTLAERGLDPAAYPDFPKSLLAPGSMVFTQPEMPTSLDSPGAWWSFVPGASWKHPLGPASNLHNRGTYPVVHIAYEDALAYAQWKGRDLPTEAEWEYAARGGLEGARYTWGESYDPVNGWKANTWQGAFPAENTSEDGHAGSAPVACYDPNGYGLYDMAGNVWEYASDYWALGHSSDPVTDPIGPDEEFAVHYGGLAGANVVIKGGSWLCAPNFCLRYRPSARQPQETIISTNHVGFRTVLRKP